MTIIIWTLIYSRIQIAARNLAAAFYCLFCYWGCNHRKKGMIKLSL